MIRNNLYLGFAFLFCIGCAVPPNVPHYKKLSENTYGSYVQVEKFNNQEMAGELIAVDSLKMIVLIGMELHQPSCVSIPVKDIKHFRLRYAEPRQFGWTIPLLAASTFLHGYFLLFTFPLNLLVTIPVTIGGANAFTYKDKDINLKQLTMFARFPQGIPEGVSLSMIK
jgi:hypothetical protein